MRHIGKISLQAAQTILLCAAMTVLMSACLSCGPVNDLRDFSDADLFPPVIENILPVDSRSIRLLFNEPVVLSNGPKLSPALGETSVSAEGSAILVSFTDNQEAGMRYVIDAEVCDETGNCMSFLIPFYGFNPNPPQLLINEFTCQGSTTHPDIIELLITGGGNLAGLWVVEGTTDYSEESICFPSCEVDEGDYLLIHFKPQGIPDEVDETGDDITISGGYDSSPSARDFWVEGGGGLSGNNGVAAVYTAPGGKLIDAVLYSNRTSASDENYDGFGSSRTLDKAVQIVEEGGWQGSGEDGRPRPEDGINPEDSTATRSICRSALPIDTNSKSDWHIVPTSSSSFGEINTDAEYEP